MKQSDIHRSKWQSFFQKDKSVTSRHNSNIFNEGELNKDSVIAKYCNNSLRHTFATILYDTGVDILTAKKLLVHSDIKTTLGIYTHLSQEKEKLNIDKLNEFLNKK